MDTSEVIAKFLAHRELKKLAEGTLKLYRRQLGVWLAWRQRHSCPPELASVTLDELDQFFQYLGREHVPHGTNPRRPAAEGPGLSPETLAAYRRVLRGLWNYARARDWLTPKQLLFFTRDGVQTPRVIEVARPVYERDDLSAVLDAYGDGEDEVSARDRTVVAGLWESGARVAELLSVNDRDLDLRRRRARVLGKGDRERFLRWGPITQHELVRYLQRRRGASGGERPTFRATGRDAGSETRLATDTARASFKRALKRAGIVPIPGSPLHAIRRGFIQDGIEGGDISEASQLAGHSDIRTTMRYARLDNDRLDELYEERYVRRRGRKRRNTEE